MPPVMRETDRKLINDRTVLIQCPAAVICGGLTHPTGFCVGVIAIELPAAVEAAEGKCPSCGWPGAVRLVETGRWAAYVGIA